MNDQALRLKKPKPWLNIVGFLDLDNFKSILDLEENLFLIFANFNLLLPTLLHLTLLIFVLTTIENNFSGEVVSIRMSGVVILLKLLINYQ